MGKVVMNDIFYCVLGCAKVEILVVLLKKVLKPGNIWVKD